MWRSEVKMPLKHVTEKAVNQKFSGLFHPRITVSQTSQYVKPIKIKLLVAGLVRLSG